MSKITKATFKSFIRKNRENLLIKRTSSFDGMCDGVMPTGETEFIKAESEQYNLENTVGIHGVWLVGGSRDYFTAYEQNGIKGIHVYNCCGSFTIGVKI